MKSLRKEAAADRREQDEDILSLERPARLRKEAAVDGLDEAFALAICVLRGRISPLPPEDENALYELLPSLLGDDEEERESEQQTVKELLDQSGGRIRPLELPIHPAESLRNGIEFVSRRIRERRLDPGAARCEGVTSSKPHLAVGKRSTRSDGANPGEDRLRVGCFRFGV